MESGNSSQMFFIHCNRRLRLVFGSSSSGSSDASRWRYYGKEFCSRIQQETCDFNKLQKEKVDDKDDIMDEKNKTQDDENELDFVAKEMPEYKTRVGRNKAG